MVVHDFPWFTSVSINLVIFFVTLALFHLSFIRIYPLSKKGWKYVDYVWLSLGTIGLISGVGASRQIIATNEISDASWRIERAASDVENSIVFGHGPAICRTFVRTEYSPANLDDIQAEYDAMCKWFQNAEKILPTTTFSSRKTIHLGDFQALPMGADQYAVQKFRDAIEDYNQAVSRLEALTELTKKSNIEVAITHIGPFLLAIALALRITKVTGELRLG